MVGDPIADEKRILANLAGGEEDAFVFVHRSFYPGIYLFARRLIPHYTELAQDAAADAFMDLWKAKPLFERFENLQKFLRVVVRNKCIDKLRMEKRHAVLEKELAYLSNESIEDIYFQDVHYTAEVMIRIMSEVEKLPPHNRQVFKLAFFKGMSNSEIAKHTGTSSASVRTRKAEALGKLRLKLRNEPLLLLCLLFVYR